MFSACLRQGLTDAGVMAKRTMKAFDEMCLTPADDMPPEKIRALRLRENASQAVFARHLNVTAGLVSQWERAEKRPRGANPFRPYSTITTTFSTKPNVLHKALAGTSETL